MGDTWTMGKWRYPLVNVYMSMEKSPLFTIFYGKTNTISMAMFNNYVADDQRESLNGCMVNGSLDQWGSQKLWTWSPWKVMFVCWFIKPMNYVVICVSYTFIKHINHGEIGILCTNFALKMGSPHCTTLFLVFRQGTPSQVSKFRGDNDSSCAKNILCICR